VGGRTCLWDTAPRLASLADNGGPVRTRALEPDSPATDGASPADVHCGGTDARGGPGNDRIVNCSLGPTPLHDLGSSAGRKAGLTGHTPFRENASVFDSPFNPSANARFDVSMT
jgi:hypothetical protein